MSVSSTTPAVSRASLVEVIRGPVTGLPIPAHAEIAIEGYAMPDERLPEGPFGEWTGYYASGVRDEPVFRVKALYHRNDPIVLGSPPVKPPSGKVYTQAILRSATLEEDLENAGVPDVKAVWCHEAGSARMFVVVSCASAMPDMRARRPRSRYRAARSPTCHAGSSWWTRISTRWISKR